MSIKPKVKRDRQGKLLLVEENARHNSKEKSVLQRGGSNHAAIVAYAANTKRLALFSVPRLKTQLVDPVSTSTRSEPLKQLE